MTPIKNYIINDSFPKGEGEARKIRTTATSCIIPDRTLYRMMRDWPLLKCMPHEERNYILREMHKGICRAHIATNVLVQKSCTTATYGQQYEKA